MRNDVARWWAEQVGICGENAGQTVCVDKVKITVVAFLELVGFTGGKDVVLAERKGHRHKVLVYEGLKSRVWLWHCLLLLLLLLRWAMRVRVDLARSMGM